MTLRVDSCLVRLNRLTRHLPPSTMHLLSRCSGLRDSRFCLIRDRRTSWVLVSSVARKATIDRISLAVFRGVSHEGRLISRGARDQEQEGNRDTQVI